MHELVDDLAVEELQQAVAPLDQGHAHAHRGEDRRVLDADDAGADDGEGPRQVRQAHDVVRGEDDLAVRLHPGRGRRLGADGDHDVGRADTARARLRPDLQRVGIGEHGFTGEQGHVVAPELILDDLDLAGDHVAHAGQQLLAGGARVEPGPGQAVPLAGDRRVADDRLAQRLARDRAGVETAPPRRSGASR
jgi:hypothetical protein